MHEGPISGPSGPAEESSLRFVATLIQVNLMRPLGSVSSTLVFRTVDLSSDRVLGLLSDIVALVNFCHSAPRWVGVHRRIVSFMIDI